MPKYNVFETTNVGAVHFAERIFDAVAATDIENGTFGYLNGLATGETHIYNFVAGTSEGAQIVVANNPAWNYDTSRITNQRRDKYIIPAGTPFRVFVLKKNDEFATAIEGVTSASRTNMDVNAYVTIDSSTGKLVASSTAPTGTPAFVGTVMRKRVSGGTIATSAHNYGCATTLYEVKVTTIS